MSEDSKNQRGYVYVLTNRWGNVLYIGSSVDLRTRIAQHKARLIEGFTKKYNVDLLVYFEELADIQSAEEREKQLKGKSRAKKNKIVEAGNPGWEDLSLKII